MHDALVEEPFPWCRAGRLDKAPEKRPGSCQLSGSALDRPNYHVLIRGRRGRWRRPVARRVSDQISATKRANRINGRRFVPKILNSVSSGSGGHCSFACRSCERRITPAETGRLRPKLACQYRRTTVADALAKPQAGSSRLAAGCGPLPCRPASSRCARNRPGCKD